MVEDVKTLGDLLAALQKLSPEQLAKPAQVVKGHPVYEKLRSAHPIICIGSVDELGLLYVRSSEDNRRHGDEIILFVDRNPFAKDGSIGQEVVGDDVFGETKPWYPKGYTQDQNWTGPAQKLVDQAVQELPDGSLGPILRYRLDSFDESKE